MMNAFDDQRALLKYPILRDSLKTSSDIENEETIERIYE